MAVADTVLSADAVLSASSVLLGWSVALQSIELLLVRHALGGDGALAWSVIRDDYAALPAPVRALLDACLGERSFSLLVVLQLTLALAVPLSDRALLPGLLLATCLLICLRFRGNYNGGSDSMTAVVILGLLIARLEPSAAAHAATFDLPLTAGLWQRIGLGYIAAQLTLSYLLAGIAKLRQPTWRDGRALPRLLGAHQYAVPAFFQQLITGPRAARLASWVVISFECAFPLSLGLGPVVCSVMLALGLSFHVLNAYALGLNRFVWAWLAAYPALLFWSQSQR